MPKPTNIRPRQRKLAQAYVSGKPYPEIAAELMPHVENPSQAVYNRLQDKGTQAAISELVDESNVLAYVTVERIIRNIQELAFDKTLKPKEREGYLRMLAEYKALLKQVNLNEAITSSDALVGEAEKALAQLKADTRAGVQIMGDYVNRHSDSTDAHGGILTHADTSTAHSQDALQSLDVAPGQANCTEGENEATGSVRKVEATPGSECEKE